MHSAELEQVRVAAHIEAAEAIAAHRDLTPLDPIQSLVRQLLLQELSSYRASGTFPQNRDFEERTPYFVDADGTRCAMAHLLEVGGEAELVSKISSERNNAWVRELADEPRLMAWLDAAGLTVAEAAAIQPSYNSIRSSCVCGGGFSNVDHPVPAKGVLEALVDSSLVAARIEKIYGESVGLKVGDTVSLDLYRGYKAGDRVLVPVDAPKERIDAGGGNPAIVLSTDGTYTCSSQGVSDAPTLTTAQFVQAVTSQNCSQTLAAQDVRWSAQSGSGVIPTPRGCGASIAGAEPTSLGILLALVSILVARKLR